MYAEIRFTKGLPWKNLKNATESLKVALNMNWKTKVLNLNIEDRGTNTKLIRNKIKKREQSKLSKLLPRKRLVYGYENLRLTFIIVLLKMLFACVYISSGNHSSEMHCWLSVSIREFLWLLAVVCDTTIFTRHVFNIKNNYMLLNIT